ncbi:MAG: hypothetical protein KA313_04015 [Pseudarcicella sp.]|nr:hypothetical protein [Pseudarcicella sp.]MBP6410242.1 hypothetical protein [Pseudarcicella sp.]
MNKFKLFAFLIASTIFSSCVSMSTLQTARVLGAGETQGAVAYSSVDSQLQYNNIFGDDTSKVTNTGKGGLIEIQAIYGINDKLDVNFKVGLLGTGSIGAKYQLLGDMETKGALSVGGSLGYLSVGDATFYDFTIPVYASYHPAEWLALYASPKLIYRTNNLPEGSSIGSAMWYGSTVGTRIGNKFGLLLEYSFMNTKALSKSVGQFATGLSFSF